MKLQNLIIIFIIIIIPMIIIFSYYLKLEAKTINLQTEYDEKLIEATREGMETFIIDTTELADEYSSLANDKRRVLNSCVNSFTTGLANKLGIGGTAKENMLQYIPAIVFVMYDGYYLYTPSYVPQTISNSKGNQLYYYDSAPSQELKITNQATQTINSDLVAGLPLYESKTVTADNLLDSYYGVDSKGMKNDVKENTHYTTSISSAKMVYKHVLKTFVPY